MLPSGASARLWSVLCSLKPDGPSNVSDALAGDIGKETERERWTWIASSLSYWTKEASVLPRAHVRSAVGRKESLSWCKNRPKERSPCALCDPIGVNILHSESRASIQKLAEKKTLMLKWIIHHLYLINLSHLCTYLAGLTREHWEQNCSRATWVPQKRHRHSLISADLESRRSRLSPLKTWLTLRCAAKIKTHGKEKPSRHRKP